MTIPGGERQSGSGEEVDLSHVAGQVQELVRAQGRVRSLLDAVLALGQGLELRAVLRRVVAAAMELVGPAYSHVAESTA